MDKNEAYIFLLKQQLEKLENIGSNPKTSDEFSFGINGWKSATISVLERIFGKDSRKISEIEKIELRRSVQIKGKDSYYIETFKETGRSIIEACIAEIEALGVPEQRYDDSKKGINLNVVQSQSNQQKIKLELIVSSLSEELNESNLQIFRTFWMNRQTESLKKLRLLMN